MTDTLAKLCKCDDWRENIFKLNAPFQLAAARNPSGNHGYDGKRFVHCPWCGSELLFVLRDIEIEGYGTLSRYPR